MMSALFWSRSLPALSLPAYQKPFAPWEFWRDRKNERGVAVLVLPVNINAHIFEQPFYPVRLHCHVASNRNSFADTSAFTTNLSGQDSMTSFSLPSRLSNPASADRTESLAVHRLIVLVRPCPQRNSMLLFSYLYLMAPRVPEEAEGKRLSS